MEREIADGMQVTGTYFGQPFTGTVQSSRGITVPPYPIQYQVTLDVPLTVFGEARTEILVGNGRYFGRGCSIRPRPAKFDVAAFDRIFS